MANFVLFLCVLTLFCIEKCKSQNGWGVDTVSKKNTTLIYPSQADIYLGALFPIHSTSLNETHCKTLKVRDGVHSAEILLYLIDRINDDPNILPGLTLGTVIMDTCYSPQTASQQSVSLIKGLLTSYRDFGKNEFTCEDGSFPVYRNEIFDKIVGVVGAQRTEVSVEVSNVLKLLRVPQVSYLSTSSVFNNHQKFPYFLRTVPSDEYQAKVLLEVMQEMEWTYASVLYSGTPYGTEGYKDLFRLSHSYGICFSTNQFRVSQTDSDEFIEAVVESLLNNSAKVVILFAEEEISARILRVCSRGRSHHDFEDLVWLASDAWTLRDTVAQEASERHVIEGSIGVHPLMKDVPEFNEHLRSVFTRRENSRNPWFSEIQPSGKKQTQPHLWLHFVQEAVYAFAHALHNVCKEDSHRCDRETVKTDSFREILFQQLQNVSFPVSDSEENTSFSFILKSGPIRYTILNYQFSRGTYKWEIVGNYSRDQLRLERSSLSYKHGHGFPTSVCGVPCQKGQVKIMQTDKCCWTCMYCGRHQYLNESTNKCTHCEECDRPDYSNTTCMRKDVVSIEYKHPWSFTAISLAGIGILSTISFAIMFWIYWDTAVIKAASRELSPILLIGIFMSFAMTFVIVAPPSSVVCGASRFFIGLCYTISYAAILMKTKRVSRIFNKTTELNLKTVNSSVFQILSVCAIVCIEVIINIIWLFYTPPTTVELCEEELDINIKFCTGLDDYTFAVTLIYPFFLICLCTVYAIQTRKCPGGFNEARHVAFANYATCIIWLVFMPLYLATEASEDIRMVSLAFSLSLGGYIQLACLFFPKIQVAIFKPEQNTPEGVMRRTDWYRKGQTNDRKNESAEPSMVFPTRRDSGVAQTSDRIVVLSASGKGEMNPVFYTS